MRGPKLRAILEDLDLLVLRGKGGVMHVRDATGRAIGSYELHEDQAYRFGWVDAKRGPARIDCLSWVEFYAELQQQNYIPRPAVVR
jgi:hypothetical protein